MESLTAMAETSLFPAIDYLIGAAYSLRPFIEPTVCLVPSALKAQIASIAELVGMDVETVAMVLGMFMCYPCGLIQSMLPFGRVKHLFSFLLGAFLLQFVLGVQWIHHLISTLACYLCFALLPPSVNKYVVPSIAIGYCIVGHVHRQYINYMGWDLDFTGAQMVLTIKLYAMAWNLYDGHLIAQAGDKLPRATKKCSQFAISECPPLLNYLGYTFCFSNVLAGPAFEYSTYLAAAEGTYFVDKDGKRKTPSRLYPVFWPLLQSLLCLAVFVSICPQFPLMNSTSPKLRPPPLEGPTSIYELGALKGWAFLFVSLGLNRSKYYFAWKNAQGASNTWYCGFEGYAEEPAKDASIERWEHSNNVDIFRCETASCAQMGTKFWNKKTALWLNRYVYARTDGSLTMTYFMSAFWHGFYPGYYLFFLSIPLLTMCERLGRAKISPLLSSPGDGRFTPYGCTTIILTHLLLAYCSVPFIFLSLEWSLEFWRGIYYSGHVVMLAFVGVCTVMPKPKLKKKEE
mmetsp:Transcript_31722/g.62922  ORF Transcript_31722/g.62922 Transcript_31722/m.62922 type:complete len:514 (+) Transcript_31722:192-1733(+)|eukprot:CAMPEP_0182455548 /NCGR_PEP_ID=MMETSP1319-20130603/1676_1 /TAXON_ID=172717 /ORGANISM="Bolidomonas pacifica, Strain RCC208" /LENGTH=513 /DNA_ID=CAMNT_0024653635 /DNA_START=126 /DNA_END=1664 /DNA_ORIENTATION=+